MLIKDGKLQLNWIIAIGVTIFIAWALSWVLIDSLIGKSSDRGAFGDKFGAINALFSGFAFAGLIVTLFMQRYELSLQRKELELQRKEMRGTKKALEEQAKTLKLQQFENTFFNMLSLHNDIVESVSVQNHRTQQTASARHAFSDILKRLKNNLASNTNPDRDNALKSVFTDICENFYPGVLGHYFRNLYRLYVFIDQSDIKDKVFYTKIIRAQLSNQELILLFYNCFYYERGENFQEYAITYELFDNLPIDQLLDIKHAEILAKRNPP